MGSIRKFSVFAKPPEYEEKWIIAHGDSSKTLGGYARLSSHYRNKRVRDKPRET